MMMIVYGCLEPILSLCLLDYNVSDAQIGLIFGIEPLAYAFSTILVPYIIPRWVEARITIITALFFLAFSTILLGPFFDELNMIAMLIGLALSGFAMGFTSIPNMPEMMKVTKQMHPMYDLDHANSFLSAMLNSLFSTG